MDTVSFIGGGGSSFLAVKAMVVFQNFSSPESVFMSRPRVLSNHLKTTLRLFCEYALSLAGVLTSLTNKRTAIQRDDAGEGGALRTCRRRK